MNNIVFLVVLALNGSGEMQFQYHKMPSMEICLECVRSAKVATPGDTDTTEVKSSTTVGVTGQVKSNRGDYSQEVASRSSGNTSRQQSILALYCTTSTAREKGQTAW